MTVEGALHVTACSSILSYALDFETVLEGGSTGVTELKSPAVCNGKASDLYS